MRLDNTLNTMGRKVTAAAFAALCCSFAFVNGCSADRPVDPSIGVDATVDSAAYHLIQFFDSYSIDVTTTVANNSDHDIFIGQNCYSGRHLQRADPADKRQLLLGMYACI